jgi:hypothetical protein
MAANVFFPLGIVTALDHIFAIPGNPVIPPNPIIPPNPVFPLVAPAAPIIDVLFHETTTTVDVLGIADIHGDTPLIG